MMNGKRIPAGSGNPSAGAWMGDLLVYIRYSTVNWLKIIALVIKHGPLDTVRDLRRYPWILVLLQVNRLLWRFIRGRRGRYRKATAMVMADIVAGVIRMMDDVFFRGERLVIHEDMVPPEIIRAMGLVPFMAELMGILMPMIRPHSVEAYIDACENAGIPPDICSLPKSTMGLTLMGHLPPALAVITSNLPCDGGMASYALMERELGLPTIRLDIPYRFTDEKAVDYFVGELKRLIGWLEARTPGRMDWERLKNICEERNRMLAFEQELWELIRIRPAPMAGEPIWLSHMWNFNVTPGSADSTRTFERIVAMGRQNLEEGVDPVGERYRALLWNPPTIHFIDIYNWAEKAYGVSLIMDSMTFNRIEPIDTGTPESMLRGLAKTIMNGPMARHTRGPAENYVNDIFHITRQFDIDMIWVAGHIGCKNTQALNGMLRELCRREGIPLLIIHYDLSDPRIVSREGIIEQIDHFMENIMKARRLPLGGDRGMAKGRKDLTVLGQKEAV
ncbi:MAG: 2-hydroxyacyl-CoA dehydratase subunit D [Thermodesulfobacteriota bacterium]